MGVALELLAWWAAGVAFWILTLSSVTPLELVVAALVAAPCAVVARAARRALGFRCRPTLHWIRWLGLVPLVLATDLVRATRLVARTLAGAGRPGKIVTRALARGGGSRSTGERAVATIAVSSTPGTVVIDVDSDSGDALMHSLFSSRPPLDEVVGS